MRRMFLGIAGTIVLGIAVSSGARAEDPLIPMAEPENPSLTPDANKSSDKTPLANPEAIKSTSETPAAQPEAIKSTSETPAAAQPEAIKSASETPVVLPEVAKTHDETPTVEKLIADEKYVDALEMLDTPNTKDTNEALRLRGIVLFKMNDYANALTNLERYREATNSDTQEIKLYIGICEMKTGRFDKPTIDRLKEAEAGTDEEFSTLAHRALGQIEEEKAKWKNRSFGIFAGTQYDTNVLLVPTSSPTSAASVVGVVGGSAKFRPVIKQDSRLEAEYQLFLGYHLSNRVDSSTPPNDLAAAADILADNLSLLGEKKSPIVGMPATMQLKAIAGLVHLKFAPYLRTLGLSASTKLVEHKTTMSQFSLGWSNNYCYFDLRTDNAITANLGQSYIFSNGHLLRGAVVLETNISDSALFAYTSNGLIADYILTLSGLGISLAANAGATSLTYKSARQDTLYQLGLMGSKEIAKLLNVSAGISQFYNKSSDPSFQYARTMISLFASKNF